MSRSVETIEREIRIAHDRIQGQETLIKALKNELEKARNSIKPEDIVPGAKFYQKRKLFTAVKTVIQYGDSGLFSLLGVDRSEFKLGAEAYGHIIPHRAGPAELAMWLVRDGWTKEPQ
ncbi:MULTISPECIES: hypothetical protein [Burkholderia]|uniref:hypothetical protein n=1 Tax=Burkholderia TaxID=32008 RepID=UPI000B7A7910|nr:MULTISPECIES: hypothetical protein [Burkholderia]MBY4725731.1 hypothetical protein [Burkholderia contaminans]MCI3969269.1 hypothetical protein [Burkholderia sp. HI4860]OXI98502.1 hypothetical protein CFB48_24190 [Burkholderia sp. AU33647]